MDSPSRDERATQNELVFRTVNEQIVRVTDRLSSLVSEIDIVCECANAGCVGAIRLRTSKFADIRHSESDFIVLPGHERTDIEEVVAREERYLVVRKDPAVVAKAARGKLAPRAQVDDEITVERVGDT